MNDDDQESVDIIQGHFYNVALFNRSCKNFNMDQLVKESYIDLISFADLYNQNRADYSIGTISCYLIE